MFILYGNNTHDRMIFSENINLVFLEMALKSINAKHGRAPLNTITFTQILKASCTIRKTFLKRNCNQCYNCCLLLSREVIQVSHKASFLYHFSAREIEVIYWYGSDFAF